MGEPDKIEVSLRLRHWWHRGWQRGAEVSRILEAADSVLSCRGDFNADLYGGGRAAERVVQHILGAAL